MAETDTDLLRDALQHLLDKAEAYAALDHDRAQDSDAPIATRCPSDPCDLCTTSSELSTAILDAKDLLEATRPATAVSANTPYGTPIFHPDFSDDGLGRAFVAENPFHGNQFIYVVKGGLNDPTMPCVASYSPLWTEVSG